MPANIQKLNTYAHKSYHAVTENFGNAYHTVHIVMLTFILVISYFDEPASSNVDRI